MKNLLFSGFLFFGFISTFNCKAQAIAGGTNHCLTVCSDSTVKAWGDNYYGELGNGSNVNSVTPASVSSLTGVVSVSAGVYFSLALKEDGTVWSWGNGPLGLAGTTSSNVPVQITSLSGITAISAGGFFALALKSDGTVWAWGTNSSGQLGDGSNTDSNIPVQVSSLTGVVSISAAGGWYGRHALALKNDSTVWAWGNNSDGELGDGSIISANVPVQVSILTGITSIGAGQEHSIALKNNGTVWTWGRNVFGQLGDGTYTDSPVPLQVPGLSNITAVGAGGSNYCMVLKSDGSVWMWGQNSYGELGNGTAGGDSNVPVQVSSLSGVSLVVKGDSLA
jgi:alpha-tubulin suppressor-like RCC1 family protein